MVRKNRKQGYPMSRPPLRRIVAIDREISKRKYPNKETLAKQLEVCTRTVARDLEFMRDSQGAPIEFDRNRNGFYYSDPNYRLAAVNLNRREVVAMYLANRILGQYRHTPWEEDFKAAFEKIAGELPPETLIEISAFDDALYFQPKPVAVHEVGIFKSIADSIVNERRIEVEYHTYQRDEVSIRKLDPYCLANVAGDWYLVAHCHTRGEVRVFSPSRIRSLKILPEPFVRPTSFCAEEYFKPGFSILLGGREYTVRLRFSKAVARYVLERQWHPSQEMKERRDGAVDMKLRVRGLDEIKRWVLSWGKEVEILAPRGLRNSVAKEAQLIGEIYHGRI